MPAITLRMYISSDQLQQRETVRRVQAYCDSHPDCGCRLQVFDVSENRELADRDGVLATPTVVRVSSCGSLLKLVGDVSDVRPLLSPAYDGPNNRTEPAVRGRP